MNLHPSFECVTYDVRFGFADVRDDRLRECSYPSIFGERGAAHAVAHVLSYTPTACVLKLASRFGELVALGPAGMGI